MKCWRKLLNGRMIYVCVCVYIYIYTHIKTHTWIDRYTHTHTFLLTLLMSSNVCISGDRPPWTHKNCWFIRAARGRQSNASMHASYTCSEYWFYLKGRETEIHTPAWSIWFHPKRQRVRDKQTKRRRRDTDEKVMSLQRAEIKCGFFWRFIISLYETNLYIKLLHSFTLSEDTKPEMCVCVCVWGQSVLCQSHCTKSTNLFSHITASLCITSSISPSILSSNHTHTVSLMKLDQSICKNSTMF